MKFAQIITALLFLTACSKEIKEPDFLLEKDRFVEVLSDFETAEAIIRLGYNRTKDSLLLNDSVYHAVFRKHSIDQAIYDSNFTYYSNRPKEFEEIYEEVIIVLSEKSAKLKGSEEKLPENPIK